VGVENIMEKHSGHRRACWKFPKTGQLVEVGDRREREKFFYNEYTSNDIERDDASTRCVIELENIKLIRIERYVKVM
jgi:hypothetical protein